MIAPDETAERAVMAAATGRTAMTDPDRGMIILRGLHGIAEIAPRVVLNRRFRGAPWLSPGFPQSGAMMRGGQIPFRQSPLVRWSLMSGAWRSPMSSFRGLESSRIAAAHRRNKRAFG